MTTSQRMQVAYKLSAIQQFGSVRTSQFLSRLSDENISLETLLEFHFNDLLETGLSESQARDFENSQMTPRELDVIDVLSEQDVNIVFSTDRGIPARLSSGQTPPWYFYFGDLSLLQSDTIGFSGSRDASAESISITERIASSAVQEGLAVISGGARGVDSAAHASALGAGGTTIVVLPQGISPKMPAINADPSQALVLSEFLPTDDWGAFRAMQRNKSIVDLSDIFVIPQAGEKGGTANAAEYAIKRKKNLWVMDLGAAYPGNERLLRIGGKPIPWNGDAPDFAGMRETTVPTPSQRSLF